MGINYYYIFTFQTFYYNLNLENCCKKLHISANPYHILQGGEKNIR